ncbi:MAG TPA: DUF177 domain-containing protein [Geobacteraceae bacterium]|nr:DUF177 domain-containing protein [Geobacteraceae bacterium]
MRIRVEGLTDAPLVLSAREPIVDYPALVEAQEDGDCTFLEPLQLDFTVEKGFGRIRVHGRVATRVRLACSRCLVDYDTDLVSTFTVFYTKSSEMPVEEEVALTEEDLVSAPYDGDYIDFTSEIEEQVLLEIPYKPLCHDDCKGLCAKCGADLNAGDCGCERSGSGFAFSALKNFKVKR